MRGLGLTLAAALAASPALAAPDPAAQGRQVFERTCAPCHGKGPGLDGSKMLPGTAALAAKYKGAKPGALEDRADLNAEVLRAFVRGGTGAMPMFRKTEISDAEIAAVAAYLAKSSRAARGR